ncbi:MAG: hypothetical protein HZB38_16135 [Planctomycetes bacterium]|nr:hypothetical protein [Planctomycetota bacterium]
MYDQPPAEPGEAAQRPYLGIFFECCGVYARVYRDERDAEYVGRCPRCMAVIRARVGRNGTTQRIFRAK